MRTYFAFFLVSGFCGLVYEVVWLRLAMAEFGVTTPLVSLVLSVFMAGLALGSALAGRLRQSSTTASSPLRRYALAELCIAASSVAVPALLGVGGRLLARSGGGASWGSTTYYVASGGWIALTLLPFCTAMGATYPLAMDAIQRSFAAEARRSFSYLYTANVLGATLGTLTSAFVLIEILGFRRTLLVVGALNALLAAAAFRLSRAPAAQEEPRETAAEAPAAAAIPGAGTSLRPLALLFLTGLASMAMEVVWTREFTPYLGTLVYAFAAILGIYLLSTFVGSRLYRLRASRPWSNTAWAAAWAALGLSGLLPLIFADPRLPLPDIPGGLVRAVLGLGPFCAATGFMTPLLVDWWSGGDARRAGTAYAVNVVGCIVGPLVAGFFLLPVLAEKWALFLLALPLLAASAWPLGAASDPARARRAALVPAGALAVAALLVWQCKDYEDQIEQGVVRRDYTATVTATGTGLDKRLLVNGIGMTVLTPITKMMIHVPAVMLPKPPEDILVICFGMGTTFRSSLSWGVRTTVVELVPSVPTLVGYYHQDGEAALRSPLANVVVDDGRRFLERTDARYDLVAIDPPPPTQAAGSSLLYTKEFYALIRERLRHGGVLAQWFPDDRPGALGAVARALQESFANVRAFHSMEGWGVHFFASDGALRADTAIAAAARMPPAAVSDMLEWGPSKSAADQLQLVLSREVPMATLLEDGVPAMQDDRPINEYFLLRDALALLRKR